MFSSSVPVVYFTGILFLHLDLFIPKPPTPTPSSSLLRVHNAASPPPSTTSSTSTLTINAPLRLFALDCLPFVVFIMADARPQGERVICHQCNNEWDRAHGGLICPRCDGDFTEIVPLSRRRFARVVMLINRYSLNQAPHHPSPPHSPPLRP